LPESESSALFNKIVEHTAATGKTSFMHVADFRAAGVGPKQVSRVLACLQRLGATTAGRSVPCKIAVRPDKNLMAGFADLSDDAQALWTKHVMPQLRRRGARRPQIASFDVRAVCRESSFLDQGSAGPAAVRGAVKEMRHEGVLVLDTSEDYSAVVPLEVLANIEQGGSPRRLVDILQKDIVTDLDVLRDVSPSCSGVAASTASFSLGLVQSRRSASLCQTDCAVAVSLTGPICVLVVLCFLKCRSVCSFCSMMHLAFNLGTPLACLCWLMSLFSIAFVLPLVPHILT